VLIPDDNAKDLKDVPEAILKDLEIVPVKHMDEVLEMAILCEGPGKLFCGRDTAVEPLASSLLKTQYQHHTRH
jgi:ATP-dependent Lon protease